MFARIAGRPVVASLVLAAAVVAALPLPAGAIPVFARRFGLTCQACHTEVPHLTPFGEAFLANGYRIPGVRPKPTLPLAVRFQTAYASNGSGDPAQPLPKSIVDEIEVLSGGAIGTRGSYWAEQYLVDGGFSGATRDAWLADRFTPDGAAFPLLVRAGQFTLPLPFDPETFRETTDHYAIWDQTAGDNPFTFFDPKIGVEVVAGDPVRSVAVTAAALQGHDRWSGLPTVGLDTMVALERDAGPVALSVYRYDGSRPRLDLPGADDRFWRNGVGLGFASRTTEVNAVYQIGNDTASDAAGTALVTSGGFVQVRQTLGERAFATARWDATAGGGFLRSWIAGGGYRPARNMRLTLFDTLQHDAITNGVRHVISGNVLVAY